MSIILSVLIPALLGFFLISILLRRERDSGLLLRLGMSFPAGMGLVTIQMFLLGLCRVPLTLPAVAVPPVLETAALAFVAWRTGTPLAPTLRLPDTARRSPLMLVLILVLSCWSLTKIGSVFLETTLRPIYAWDAWYNWSAGAKAFFYSHDLFLDAPPEDFFGKGIVSRYIEYPLHNTLSQVWFALWIGDFDEVLVKLGSPTALLCLSAVFFSYAKERIGTFFALLMLVIFLSSPLLSFHAIEAYSDLYLGMYLFLSLAAFSWGMQGRPAYWTLAGLFSAFALFTKAEAPFFVLPLMLSAILFLVRDRSGAAPPLRRTLGKLLFPLLLVAPWFLFKAVNRIGVGAGGMTAAPTYHPEVIITMVNNLLSLNNFFVVPLFLVLFLLFAGRPARTLIHLLVPVACLAAFFASVYGFTAVYYETFSRGTVFFRNVLTAYPSLCLLLVLLVDRLLPAEWRDVSGPVSEH